MNQLAQKLIVIMTDVPQYTKFIETIRWEVEVSIRFSFVSAPHLPPNRGGYSQSMLCVHTNTSLARLQRPRWRNEEFAGETLYYVWYLVVSSYE